MVVGNWVVLEDQIMGEGFGECFGIEVGEELLVGDGVKVSFMGVGIIDGLFDVVVVLSVGGLGCC